MGTCCGKKPEKDKDEESIYDEQGNYIGKIKKESAQPYQNRNDQQRKQQGNPGRNDQQKQQTELVNKKRTESYNQGKGIQIGGAVSVDQNKNQADLLAEAAEKRLSNQQNRGLTKQGQIEMEFKIQKQKEMERLEREKGNDNFALKWK